MLDRRRFLKRSAGAALAAGAFANRNAAAVGANERVTLGLIGGGKQGRGLALRAIEQGARFQILCDPDPAVLQKTGADLAAAQNLRLRFATDFERVLEEGDIDAVVIAAPDHWHARMAILACQAGKDVYCESPLCQSMEEGRRIQDVVGRHRRVMQVGIELRSSEHVRSAVELAASGSLGRVALIKAESVDVGLWAIQLMRGQHTADCLPRRIAASGGSSRQIVRYDYGDLLLHCEARLPSAETVFYGEDGTLRVTVDKWELYWNDGKVESGMATGGSHIANFLACIRSRKRPNADVEVGRLDAMLRHLGSISFDLGREVRFDARTETFGGDEEANRLLGKSYRAPSDCLGDRPESA